MIVTPLSEVDLKDSGRKPFQRNMKPERGPIKSAVLVKESYIWAWLLV